MHFSLDGSGWMKSSPARGRVESSADARLDRLSLLDLEAEVVAAGLVAKTADQGAAHTQSARVEALVSQAALLREVARRSGRVESLARAACAAGRAALEAGADRCLRAMALLEQAMIMRLGAALFGDEDSAIQCAGVLDLVEGLQPSALTTERVKAMRAGLSASAALGWNDARQGAEAAHSLSAATETLTALGANEPDVAQFRLDRAELLMGLGERNHDRALLKEAEADLHRLTHRLDPRALPLTWGRAKTLQGKALAALGDVTGDPAAIAEAIVALTAALAVLPPTLSPLDCAHANHALGLALQAMGEACDEEALFDRAVDAFSPALEALDQVPALPFRAVAAHDGAACLARRAERRGDLKALEQAERVFRDALKARTSAADPLAWAVTQVALARIYEAQSGLRRDTGERADAAFALAAALDVFAERGMRSLSDAALNALNRVKQPA